MSANVAVAAPLGVREKVRAFIEHPLFDKVIIGVIVLNAVTLGMETSPKLVERYGGVLHTLDTAALWVFVVELLARMFVYRARFFHDPWRVFDFVIVGIALVPAAGAFSVLRALRILRVLRLISMVPSMRGVVSALLAAVPGMASIIALLALVLYVSAVMATKLFGELSPDYFGDLGATLFTLFQIMTMEGWAEIARDLMAKAPLSWIFFVVYILTSTFTVLNLFIAVVVNAMQSQVAEDIKVDEELHTRQLLDEIRALRAEVREMRSVRTGP